MARGGAKRHASDQRWLIQREHRLIGSQQAVSDDFHQDTLETGGKGKGIRSPVGRRKLAAGMMVWHGAAFMIVAVIVVMRILMLAVAGIAVGSAFVG